jgi:hypothetical protein
LLESIVERVRDASQGYVSSQPLQGDEEQGLSFIPFEHTRFSKQNIQAMALLIMLFER